MPQLHLFTVGSPHGDDRIGWEFAATFQQESEFLGVKLVRLRTPIEMLHHLTGGEAAIIVDACQSGQKVGSLFRYDWPAIELEVQGGTFSHGFDVQEVLLLAKSLNVLPEKVILWAVEVRKCNPGDPLSSAVEQAIPKLVEEVRGEIEQIQCGQKFTSVTT